MHVIAGRTIWEYGDIHTDARKPLLAWLCTVEKSPWWSIDDIRVVYPKTDSVKVKSGKNVYVFNIKGNNYRLVVAIHFNRQKVFVLRFMSHPEYDRQAWKVQL
jgi:mRNA interferase HigB